MATRSRGIHPQLGHSWALDPITAPRTVGAGAWLIEDPRSRNGRRSRRGHFVEGGERAPVCGEAPLASNTVHLEGDFSRGYVVARAPIGDGSDDHFSIGACQFCTALVLQGRDLREENRLRREALEEAEA